MRPVAARTDCRRRLQVVFLFLTMFLLSGLLERRDLEQNRRHSDYDAQRGDGPDQALRLATAPPSGVSSCHQVPPFFGAGMREAPQGTALRGFLCEIARRLDETRLQYATWLGF